MLKPDGGGRPAECWFPGSSENDNIGERYAEDAATSEERVHAKYLALNKTKYQGLLLAVHERIANAMLPVFTHKYYLWFNNDNRYCLMVRDIVGNPLRSITINSTWLTPTVSNLATIAYEQRALPSGELDTARLTILADALEDAGCDNQEILGHLRSPGPHVRGCHVLDLILGKNDCSAVERQLATGY